MQYRPVDYDVAPDAGLSDFDAGNVKTNLVPSSLWRTLRRAGLINDIVPKAACWQGVGGENVYWLHDRQRAVLLAYDADADSASLVRLLPVTAGAVTASASSSLDGNTPDRAYDGNTSTFWRPGSEDSEEWLQAVFAADVNLDSVKISATDNDAGPATDLGYVRGIRVRASAHQDTTRTAAVICQELVDTIAAHGFNRAYVFVYEGPTQYTEDGGFWFDSGTADYVPFGSDGADFLATFIPLAAAAGIDTFASFPFIQNYLRGEEDAWYIEAKAGGPWQEFWLCPNKPGVWDWFKAIVDIVLTAPAYAGLAGVDLAEPQVGFQHGSGDKACWCSYCQASFAASYPTGVFGRVDTRDAASVETPTDTDFTNWRATNFTAYIAEMVGRVRAAGKLASVVSFFGINPVTGEQLDVAWKRHYEAFDLHGVLDAANCPDEIVGQLTWQEKAAASKDYVTFSPEWTEYGVRWFLDLVKNRAKPVVHIGSYGTTALGGEADFAYGFDHDITEAEMLEALKAACRGGARHLEGYAVHTAERWNVWGAYDSLWTSDEYNSVLCEVQKLDGSDWVPVGRQAWFRPRLGGEGIVHFARVADDRYRTYIYPAPHANRHIQIQEVEHCYHPIQADSEADIAGGTAVIWGGMDFDNKSGGTGDLWAVRWTSTQAYLHRIDETTGLDAGGGPFAVDNYDLQAVNDLCVLPEGDEPRILVLGQGELSARARLQRYSTAAPGTLASTNYLSLGHRFIGYGGLAYQPASANGSAHLAIALNTPVIGQRFYWCDPTTLAEDSAGHADSETAWMWGAGLCWAGTTEGDLLFSELGGHGVFLVRRCGKVTNGAAESDAANVTRWTQPSVTLTLHPERALSLSTTSTNRLLRVCLYAWDKAADGYLAPSVAAYGISADGVETLVGQLSEEASWGNVKLLTLHLEKTRPECQSLKLVATRAVGATYIGILEVAVNMAITRGDVVTEILAQLNDEGPGDYKLSRIQRIAGRAYCDSVVALKSNKQNISVPLMAGQRDYSLEPCYEVTGLHLGGQELEHKNDGDPGFTTWDSLAPGVPDSYRQETGATYRLSPTPSAGALGLIGSVAEAPTAGGTLYAVGDILTVVEAGASGGQVKVKTVATGGVVTALELIMRNRSMRGTGYSTGAGKATSGGSGAGCTVEILTLAELEVVGHSGVTVPATDADLLTAIPEHLIMPTVVPLGAAMALEERRTGTVNLDLAGQKRAAWAGWTGFGEAALKPKR